MTPDLASDVVNSLNLHVAVLAEDGTIVAVNEAWRRFARENGGEQTACYVGTNYLDVCRSAVGRGGDGFAQAMLDGVQALLRGERDSFAIEYPCNTPAGERWFIARVTPFRHRQALHLLVVHKDITERKQSETALQQTQTTLRNVLDTLPVGVWITDRNGRIVEGNPASQRIWGGARYVGPEEFGAYKGWWLDTGRPIAPREWSVVRAIEKGESSTDEEIRIECFDGTSKIILNAAAPLRDAQGNINGAIIVNQDITARKRAEDELRKAHAAVDAVNRELEQVLAREKLKARTDELTGLGNRRHFFELADQLFAVAHRYHSPFSVILLDVDRFKQINDRFGHQAGDAVLQRVANIAREHTREADVLARYGGEEFIIALPNTSGEEALSVAEHIRAITGMSAGAGDAPGIAVTISAGVASMVSDDDTLERIIRRADQSLYAAKDAGRNCSRLFS